MAENTAISWADATFNPFLGCTKVSPACDNCYAEALMKRYGRVEWGAGKKRIRTSAAYWKQPLAWDRKAVLSGYRPRVFCASLADVFDNEVDPTWRVDLWALLRATPNLRWMLLTKRIGNAAKMLPPDWPFPHVGLMSTLESQEVWDRDYHKLAALPAAWHGVSAEPLLSAINIGAAKPDWLISGGESGPRHRYTDPAWVRSLRDQCAANGIAFHHKQWSGLRPKENGCDIDGVEHKYFPAALAA